MPETFLDFIEQAFAFVGIQILTVLKYPFLSNQRIFWLYLISSAILALYVYRMSIKPDSGHKPSFRAFIRFLFPKYIWQSSSAWLDVRYFFFHQIFRLVIYGVFLAGVINLTFQYVSGGANLIQVSSLTNDIKPPGIMISVIYMFGLVAVVDLAAYGLHYLQHKVPLLWEFHKVHHSLEVMHPLSNYREHPVDNILYAVATGLAYGLFIGLVHKQAGGLPDVPQILGIPLVVVAFNLLGYNLRHSHVWLRWPGRWSMLFASPAHHQIHHSYHPDQRDKNFAFIFPFWDVLFGTYHLPETNKDVHFGISSDYVTEFKSCLGIYVIPFKNAYTLVFNGLRRLLNKQI